MPVRMTKTTYARGAKNALICGIGVLVCGLTLAVGISCVSGKPLSESIGLAFMLFSAVTAVLFFGIWIYHRQVAGQVELDCGTHPARKLFFISAVLLMGFSLTSFGSRWQILSPIFGASCSIFYLFLATGRLQMREAGIWCYWELLRWDKIESYTWAADNTLLFTTKRVLPLLNQGALSVAPELKAAVEESLRKHFPSSTAQ